MRIQHNIMSMNAYRNYNNNASALSKNLEKLSSGYKINRAGDDAAGLAISEKMRAQIKGLEAAQKNVKDGISLVKTAEGAMQEIQDMLSRMKYLATQSSNGTYDDEVDRRALQDEVDQLNSEINRIADSANFNGTKLLDGSLGGSGSTGGAGKTTLVEVDGKGAKAAITAGTAQAQVNTVTMEAIAAGNMIDDGDTVTVDLKLSDGTAVSVQMKWDKTNKALKSLDGNTTYVTAAADTTITNAEMATAAAAALNTNSDLKDKFTVAAATNTVTLTANDSAFDTATVESLSITTGGKVAANYSAKAVVTTEGKGDHQQLDVTSMTVFDSTQAGAKTEDAIFTVGGKKFALVKDLDKDSASFDKDVTLVKSAATPTAAEAKTLAAAINQKTGLNLKVDTTTTTSINLYSKGSSGAGGTSGDGLQLQIGDTSDSFNQLMVTVGDLHADAIGVGSNVDISSITGASASIDKIKDAINTVSAIRGKLGATQNRLEHTANNLSVMTENITDAESTIRDTDVADEMMAYTKNNILIQSAQAMLAQANSVPQGVLQLLQ